MCLSAFMQTLGQRQLREQKHITIQQLQIHTWQTAAAKAIYLGILDYYKAKGYDVESLYSVAK